jgi:hypothetical protein
MEALDAPLGLELVQTGKHSVLGFVRSEGGLCLIRLLAGARDFSSKLVRLSGHILRIISLYPDCQSDETSPGCSPQPPRVAS